MTLLPPTQAAAFAHTTDATTSALARVRPRHATAGHGALERLLAAARALPPAPEGAQAMAGGPLREWSHVGATGAPAATEPTPSPDGLRRRVGVLLLVMAERLDPALESALSRAEQAWGEFDQVVVLDETLQRCLEEVMADVVALEAGPPEGHAVALETRVVLDAAVGIVRLLERRLATLVRLRLRGDDRRLLPEGRPFLDASLALAEAARGWC